MAKYKTKINYEFILKKIKEITKCELLTTKEEFDKQIEDGTIPSSVELEIKCHCGNKYKCKIQKISRNTPIIECEDCRRLHKYNIRALKPEKINKILKPHKLYIKNTDNIHYDTMLDVHCYEGHIFTKKYSALKQKPFCPYCSGFIFTYEYTKKYIEQYAVLLTTKKEFIKQYMLVEKPKTDIILLIKCKNCDNTYLNNFSNFKGRKQYLCSDCLDIKEKQEKLDNFKNKALKYGHEVLSDEYIDYWTPMKLKCSCGEIYSISKSQFDMLAFRGEVGCTVCNPISEGSKGENKIKNYLNEKVTFSKEYTIENLRGINGGMVRYDFAIFDEENKLKLLIEYDGQQHYYQVNFGGMSDEEAFSSFINTVYNDSLKNSYCEDNNIPLLRIPYWDYANIEQILEDNILSDLK